ncbi:ras association domain-containing protein 8 isoform X2 [Xyrichtys novacula]|uniref:Ras association domain-containing protein 8 isoform X2 n=1 Tax=Xyrichtys novacula TaxID=13765 RepID=A0AAV1F301_XYRNO|nr:ras association domain-containing protein 8 isoform X2 [Xyrichtys novacula]
MEVKVSVDGIQRVVCGITEETTCQDVVVVLAQALGQPGRYTLREKFKDFERCMTPDEHLLETLKKYGEQAKEVQLTLLHNRPSVLDDLSKTKVGRYQPCPPMRRKDAGPRMRRGSSSLSLHRQSLPPLSCSRQEVDPQKEELKRPKRKSLTLMEEAWEWLESLGKGKVYSTAGDKESSKKSDRRNRASLNVTLAVDKEDLSRSSRSKIRGQKGLSSDLDNQTSCCMGSPTKEKESKHSKKPQDARSDEVSILRCAPTEDEKVKLRERIINQLGYLQDLQVQIAHIDKLISELEERQKIKQAKQEAEQRMAEEEMAQIHFWENELRAEEGFERDLQCQFLEMRTKAVGVKAKLEDYKRRMRGLDYFAPQAAHQEDLGAASGAASEISAASVKDQNQQRSHPEVNVNTNRKFPPREDSYPPHALVTPSQIKERRPTGPTELREWWTRWSEAQSPQSQTKKKMIHRSELTIYLGSTKV